MDDEAGNRDMISRQIEARGIRDGRVLAAMRNVPRQRFVPFEFRQRAYEDCPLPLLLGQTISQPYIVAKMTELLGPEKTGRILEIGTGSGYQTAILAELAGEVWSMEIKPELHGLAKENLAAFPYTNIRLVCGNGYEGLPDEAPFDGIIVTAAPPTLPLALADQLAPLGRMVIPVGTSYQILYLITKDSRGELHPTQIFPVVFVPLVDG